MRGELAPPHAPQDRAQPAAHIIHEKAKSAFLMLLVGRSSPTGASCLWPRGLPRYASTPAPPPRSPRRRRRGGGVTCAAGLLGAPLPRLSGVQGQTGCGIPELGLDSPGRPHPPAPSPRLRGRGGPSWGCWRAAKPPANTPHYGRGGGVGGGGRPPEQEPHGLRESACPSLKPERRRGRGMGYAVSWPGWHAVAAGGELPRGELHPCL